MWAGSYVEKALLYLDGPSTVSTLLSEWSCKYNGKEDQPLNTGQYWNIRSGRQPVLDRSVPKRGSSL